MIIIKHAIRYAPIGLVTLLSACSNSYDDYVYQKPQARSLPNIPEIASVRVEPPPQYIPAPRASVKPKQQVKIIKRKLKPKTPKVRKYKPKVHKYSPEKAINTVITQKEVATVTLEKQWEEAEKNAVVDTDPYANIPESRTVVKPVITKSTSVPKRKPVIGIVKSAKPIVSSSAPIESSMAVRSLLVRARADLALGRTSSAIAKLERGLRIEPHNSDLWYQLAKTHYSDKDYVQTVNMAKKSIRNTNRDYVIAKNWMLIKKAGRKSGDTVVVKEANNYFKVNP